MSWCRCGSVLPCSRPNVMAHKLRSMMRPARGSVTCSKLSRSMIPGLRNSKVQSNTASSALAGFSTAIATLSTSITDVESQLENERQTVARREVSEELANQILQVSEMLPAWLQFSRKFASVLEVLPSFEASQMASYVRNATSELEMAAKLTIEDLHRAVAAIRDGSQPIPRKAPVVIDVPKTKPAPTTALLFLTQPLAWYDDGGVRHRAPATHDAEIPLHLVTKARSLNAAHDIDSPEREKWDGQKTSAPPEWHHCTFLNEVRRRKATSRRLWVRPSLRTARSRSAGHRPHAGAATRRAGYCDACSADRGVREKCCRRSHVYPQVGR